MSVVEFLSAHSSSFLSLSAPKSPLVEGSASSRIDSVLKRTLPVEQAASMSASLAPRVVMHSPRKSTNQLVVPFLAPAALTQEAIGWLVALKVLKENEKSPSDMAMKGPPAAPRKARRTSVDHAVSSLGQDRKRERSLFKEQEKRHEWLATDEEGFLRTPFSLLQTDDWGMPFLPQEQCKRTRTQVSQIIAHAPFSIDDRRENRLQSNVESLLQEAATAKKSVNQERQSTSGRRAQEISQQVEQNRVLEQRDHRFPLAFVAKGDFIAAYKISDDDKEPFSPPLENQTLLLKVFKQELFSERSLRAIGSYIEESVSHYHQLVAHNVPVAVLYNDPQEQGYFLTNYLPYGIDKEKLWPSHLSFEELSAEQIALLEQVRAFINFAIDHIGVMAFDIPPANFRVSAEGMLRLVDFNMEKLQGEELAYLTSSLLQWCNHQPAMLHFLLKERKDTLTAQEIMQVLSAQL